MPHFILNKPYGYLSQFVNNGPKKGHKKLLGELFLFPPQLMAIGRLDEPSEGLLLLTTDGKLSEKVRSSKVEKEYQVQLDGIITKEAIDRLRNGVQLNIEGKIFPTRKCRVEQINEPSYLPNRSKKIRDERHGPTSWISITIREGKFRQIRKMTALVGFPTLRLIRCRIGNIHLNTMKAGEVIEVSSFDLGNASLE